MLSFKQSATLATIVCALLFATLLLAPQIVYWLFQIESHETADFIARRAAFLFLGLSAISFMGRNNDPSPMRRAFCTGLVFSMTGLALLGLFELARGAAGPGILLAIAIEALFAVLFFKHIKEETSQ